MSATGEQGTPPAEPPAPQQPAPQQPQWYGYPPRPWPPASYGFEASTGGIAAFPPPAVEQESDRPYLSILLTSTYRAWRPLAGMTLFTVVTLAATLVVLVPLFVFGIGGGLDSVDDLASPSGLLFTNLSLAVLIPCAMFAAWAAHRVRPGMVSSVVGRIRWKWLAAYSGIALLVTLFTFGLSGFVGGDSVSTAGPEPSFVGWEVYLPLVLVILVTTPLQAAGEEYAFRGYLAQAIGAWAKTWTWVPVLITSFLFALAHGQQDPALFTDRFMFGLALALITIRTGGLEAGIALHAANNVVILLVSASFDDLADTLTSTQASWDLVAVDAVQLVIYGAIVWAMSGRMQRTTNPAPAATPAGAPRAAPPGTTVTPW
jgi:membrane protease YdiL (CAAX protease family)